VTQHHCALGAHLASNLASCHSAVWWWLMLSLAEAEAEAEAEEKRKEKKS